MSDDLIAVTRADKEAAFKLVVGDKVGAGDGNTYVVRAPSIAQVEQAFARHRQQAEDAMRERCARICEEFPLAEDHPDAGVLGCRDMEIATAIRATPPKTDRLNEEGE